MLYFFKFCFIVIRFGLRLVWVRKRAIKQAMTYVEQIEKKLQGKFDAATFKKVVKSHSVYLAIVNDAFTLLHGRTTSAIEQERSIHYFICSSLFDNFFDNQQLTLAQIEAITFQPHHFQPTSFDESAFLQSHLFLLNGMKDTTEYLGVLRKEFDAQVASMEQFDSAITNQAIEHITFEKGGNAVLMCRYYLDIIPTKEEEACWYLLGSMIQLSNDLFDIYKDLQENIQTLANRTVDAHAMQSFYLRQVNSMKQKIQLLPYSATRKEAFSISMAATYTLGLVAIRQLKQIQGNLKSLPALAHLPRKQLIVDMEKPKNICYWIKFLYRHGKL